MNMQKRSGAARGRDACSLIAGTKYEAPNADCEETFQKRITASFEFKT